MRHSPLARRQSLASEPTAQPCGPRAELPNDPGGNERVPNNLGKESSQRFEDPVSTGLLDEDEGMRLFGMSVDPAHAAVSASSLS